MFWILLFKKKKTGLAFCSSPSCSYWLSNEVLLCPDHKATTEYWAYWELCALRVQDLRQRIKQMHPLSKIEESFVCVCCARVWRFCCVFILIGAIGFHGGACSCGVGENHSAELHFCDRHVTKCQFYHLISGASKVRFGNLSWLGCQGNRELPHALRHVGATIQMTQQPSPDRTWGEGVRVVDRWNLLMAAQLCDTVQVKRHQSVFLSCHCGICMFEICGGTGERSSVLKICCLKI